MKKIIVFGATGGTGKPFVEQALAAGYHVTVVARNPHVFTASKRNLEIIRGDVLKPATFESAIYGKDAVVSCLGSTDTKPTTVYSKGTGNIAAAMTKAGVKRIICISAGAVVVPPKANVIMKFVVKNILQRIFKYVYADMLLMEKLLSESNLDWTAVRAPRLTNGVHTGKFRSSVNEPLNSPGSISRADLADYMLKILGDEKTFKAKTEVSY